MNAALAMIEAAAPKDEIEGALAVQLACTHTAAMAVLAKLDVGFATEKQIAAFGSAAARLMRAFATQVEVLRRLRNGGHQFGQALLTSFGPVPVKHRAYKFTYVSNDILTASNITAVSSTQPQFSNPTITSLPVAPGGGSWIWANCSKAVVPTYSGQVSVQEQRGVSISVSNGVSHTEGSQIGFSFAPPKDYGGFGFNGSINSSNSWTTTTVNQNSYQQQFTYQTTVGTTNLPADHAVRAVTTVDQLSLSIPFSATVTVDADVSPNEKGYQKLSQMFPDPSKRTFTLKGTVAELDWADAKSSVVDTPIEPEYCQDQPAGVVTLPISSSLGERQIEHRTP